MRYLSIFENFNTPTKTTKDRVKSMVVDLLDKFEGGPLFFLNLDKQIKDPKNEDIIIELLSGCKNEWVCSSGEFGEIVFDLWMEGKIKCKGVVYFNGKIVEKRSGIHTWTPKEFIFKGKEFIYVDDSYFSGRTSDMVDNFLKDNGAKLKDIYVIYNGSSRNKNIKSFFSYCDDMY